ncbi:hypothetical protein HPG69_011161 [Diceros bicornis minor]|uniref:Uncharacterized protein n=1 Tax=Diceros bicornis minor TaxID=77932 RepID=A0A7J7EGS6_DICBM|nr:hypothetical protein HPG69_011161 [Diceros bicornis minor]
MAAAVIPKPALRRHWPEAASLARSPACQAPPPAGRKNHRELRRTAPGALRASREGGWGTPLACWGLSPGSWPLEWGQAVGRACGQYWGQTSHLRRESSHLSIGQRLGNDREPDREAGDEVHLQPLHGVVRQPGQDGQPSPHGPKGAAAGLRGYTCTRGPGLTQRLHRRGHACGGPGGNIDQQEFNEEQCREKQGPREHPHLAGVVRVAGLEALRAPMLSKVLAPCARRAGPGGATLGKTRPPPPKPRAPSLESKVGTPSRLTVRGLPAPERPRTTRTWVRTRWMESGGPHRRCRQPRTPRRPRVGRSPATPAAPCSSPTPPRAPRPAPRAPRPAPRAPPLPDTPRGLTERRTSQLGVSRCRRSRVCRNRRGRGSEGRGLVCT